MSEESVVKIEDIFDFTSIILVKLIVSGKTVNEFLLFPLPFLGCIIETWERVDKLLKYFDVFVKNLMITVSLRDDKFRKLFFVHISFELIIEIIDFI